MTNLKYKSLVLAASLIAGVSFTAAGYANECHANGSAQVRCMANDYVTHAAGCAYSFTTYAGHPSSGPNHYRILHATCGSATPSFVCGTPNTKKTGIWTVDANKNFLCKS